MKISAYLRIPPASVQGLFVVIAAHRHRFSLFGRPRFERHLPTCPTIIHLIGGLFTRRSQFLKLLLSGRVVYTCCELSILFGLLVVIVGVVPARAGVPDLDTDTILTVRSSM